MMFLIHVKLWKAYSQQLRDLTRTPHNIYHNLTQQTQTHFKTFKIKEASMGSLPTLFSKLAGPWKLNGLLDVWDKSRHSEPVKPSWAQLDPGWNSLSHCHVHTSGTQMAQLRTLATGIVLAMKSKQKILK